MTYRTGLAALEPSAQAAWIEKRVDELWNALQAAYEFEREYQRQRGAVLSSDDYAILDDLQTRFLEAFKKATT